MLPDVSVGCKAARASVILAFPFRGAAFFLKHPIVLIAFMLLAVTPRNLLGDEPEAKTFSVAFGASGKRGQD